MHIDNQSRVHFEEIIEYLENKDVHHLDDCTFEGHLGIYKLARRTTDQKEAALLIWDQKIAAYIERHLQSNPLFNLTPEKLTMLETSIHNLQSHRLVSYFMIILESYHSPDSIRRNGLRSHEAFLDMEPCNWERMQKYIKTNMEPLHMTWTDTKESDLFQVLSTRLNNIAVFAGYRFYQFNPSGDDVNPFFLTEKKKKDAIQDTAYFFLHHPERKTIVFIEAFTRELTRRERYLHNDDDADAAENSDKDIDEDEKSTELEEEEDKVEQYYGDVDSEDAKEEECDYPEEDTDDD